MTRSRRFVGSPPSKGKRRGPKTIDERATFRRIIPVVNHRGKPKSIRIACFAENQVITMGFGEPESDMFSVVSTLLSDENIADIQDALTTAQEELHKWRRMYNARNRIYLKYHPMARITSEPVPSESSDLTKEDLEEIDREVEIIIDNRDGPGVTPPPADYEIPLPDPPEDQPNGDSPTRQSRAKRASQKTQAQTKGKAQTPQTNQPDPTP